MLATLCVALNNCSGLKDAGNVLRNEKVTSTDEFLIKKKEPLTQPPDFDTIPEPGSIEANSAAELKKKNIKKILKTSRSKSNRSDSKTSSTEDSILNQIKK